MSEACLHGLERGIHHRGRCWEIRITHLQTDKLSSAGFECQDAVCHCHGRRLSDGIELNVEALHNNLTKNSKQFISIIQISSTCMNSCTISDHGTHRSHHTHLSEKIWQRPRAHCARTRSCQSARGTRGLQRRLCPSSSDRP